ncbi:MAG: hypothetical protein ACE5OZ_21815 [Candidatus Heimdallarchaeota archaeon]
MPLEATKEAGRGNHSSSSNAPLKTAANSLIRSEVNWPNLVHNTLDKGEMLRANLLALPFVELFSGLQAGIAIDFFGLEYH